MNEVTITVTVRLPDPERWPADALREAMVNAIAEYIDDAEIVEVKISATDP